MLSLRGFDLKSVAEFLGDSDFRRHFAAIEFGSALADFVLAAPTDFAWAGFRKGFALRACAGQS